jgi:chorismate mutase/prephenate dehydratase
MEFEGHQQDEAIQTILTELQEQTVMLKVLGSYPRAVF